MRRSPALAHCIEVLSAALADRTAPWEPAGQLERHVTGALCGSAGQPSGEAPAVLPACRYLDAALSNAASGPTAISALAHALRSLSPELTWRRSTRASPGNPWFRFGHANTQIVGPEGLERRSDVVVGTSLLAPHIVYPEHSHPPREVYLVLSEGDWFNTDAGWYTPGVGGVVYHPSGITHAMRSAAKPLLAVWCMWPQAAAG